MELKLLLLQLQVSAAVLLVLALRQGIKRLPKIYSYILWILVFTRLLFPVSLETSISFMPSMEQSRTWLEQLLTDKYAHQTDYPAAVQNGREPKGKNPLNEALTNQPVQYSEWQALLNRRTARQLNEVYPAQKSNESSESTGSPHTAAEEAFPDDFSGLTSILSAFIWLSGVLFVLVRNGVILAGMQKKTKNARLSEEKNVYVCEKISVPFTLGILFPRIYLPASLKGAERDYILCHEKVHIRRKDYLVKNTAFLLLAFNWFNPFLWAAFHFLESDMEMSCDEKVVRLMGPQIKRQYSQSLLDFAAGSRKIAATPLTFGANNVQQRIRNVLSCKSTVNRKNRRRNVISGAFLFLITGIFLFTTGAGQAEEINDANPYSPEDTSQRNKFFPDPSTLSKTLQNSGLSLTSAKNEQKTPSFPDNLVYLAEQCEIYSEEGLKVYYNPLSGTLFWSVENEENTEFIYPGYVSPNMSWCILDKIMYFTADSRYKEFTGKISGESSFGNHDTDSDYRIDSICVLDLTTGQYDNETLMIQDNPVAEEDVSVLDVSEGYVILYKKQGKDIVLPLTNTYNPSLGSIYSCKDIDVENLEEEYQNDYGFAVREYLLNHPGQLLEISNHTAHETYVLIDMDGDRIAEKISLSRDPDAPEDEGYYPYDCYLLQAGQSKLTGRAERLSNLIWAFSPDGSRIFLALHAEVSGLDTETLLFTYNSGELIMTGILPDDIRYCTIDDSSIVATRMIYDSMIPLCIKEIYQLKENGELEAELQEVYDLITCSGELTVSLPVHDNPGSEAVYYLEPQSITLTKIDNTGQWLCLEEENGEEGWFLIEGEKGSRIAELDRESSEVLIMYYAG